MTALDGHFTREQGTDDCSSRVLSGAKRQVFLSVNIEFSFRTQQGG